jgi:putative transposase
VAPPAGDARQRRRVELTSAIREAFEASGRTYGSPRVLVDLRAAGWRVTKHTIAKLMAAEGLVARTKRRRRSLTRPDKRAVPFPDLVCRDFSAPAPNVRWCGDVKQIDTLEGPLYLASVEDLFSRRMLGFAMSEHSDAVLCRDALHMAATIRGGDVAGGDLPFRQGQHQHGGPVHQRVRQARHPTVHGTRRVRARQRGCRVVLLDPRRRTPHPQHVRHPSRARRAVARWINEFYNPRRRHSTCAMLSAIDYEHAATPARAAA